MTTTTSRPGPRYLVVLVYALFAVGLLVMASLGPGGPQSNAEWFVRGFCWATIAGALLVVVWWRRARIVAAEGGLRWRSLGGWRFVPWSGVERCSIETGTRGQCTYIVQTRRGTLRFTPFWRNGDDLYSLIQTHARAIL